MLRRTAVAAAAVWGLAVASAPPAGAIIGGEPATPQDAPYGASIVLDGWTGKSHVCGGFLISATKVVTAAHCVDGATTNKAEVRWGGLERTKLPESSPVSRIAIYPGFDSVTMFGDVAVLTLTVSASETDGVQFAKLASAAPEAGETATVTGWGATDPQSTSPSKIAYTVQVPIVDTPTCQADYPVPEPGSGGDGRFVLDPDSMICAGPAAGGQGLGAGDSGDPLVVGGQVVGIASWARRGAGPDSPAVYSSVPKFRDWIISQ